MNVFLIVLCFFMGMFSILGAILDWNWFFESRKSAIFVRLFGRNGARIFYIVLGLFIIIAGTIGGVTNS